MKLKEYCSQHSGSQRKLADYLGVTVAFVNHLVQGRRSVPVRYCIQIEQYTNGTVSRRDLRPEDYSQIWPELAAPVS